MKPNLPQYLKRFKNIAWYPSSGQDGTAMACLTFQALSEFGIAREEVPDCFLYTDYRVWDFNDPFCQQLLHGPKGNGEVTFYESKEKGIKVSAFNVEELPSLKVGFDSQLVNFERDPFYYGRVYIADMLIEYSDSRRAITKLVYVFAENTHSHSTSYFLTKSKSIMPFIPTMALDTEAGSPKGPICSTY